MSFDTTQDTSPRTLGVLALSERSESKCAAGVNRTPDAYLFGVALYH